MMLSVFTFERQNVRLIGTAENPVWVAQDVCDVLENGEASNALRNFDNK